MLAYHSFIAWGFRALKKNPPKPVTFSIPRFLLIFWPSYPNVFSYPNILTAGQPLRILNSSFLFLTLGQIHKIGRIYRVIIFMPIPITVSFRLQAQAIQLCPLTPCLSFGGLLLSYNRNRGHAIALTLFES